MRRGDELDIIDDRVALGKDKLIDEGEILSAEAGRAIVRLRSTPTPQPARCDDQQHFNAGNHVMVMRATVNDPWTIMTRFVDQRTGLSQQPTTTELAPPSNLRVIAAIPGAITVAWDVPAQVAVDFEVQTSPTGDDELDDATSVLWTRGALCIVVADTPLSVRVRSLGFDFSTSSWSDWLLCVPTAPPTLDGLSDVDVSSPDPYDVLYFNPVSAQWEAMPNPLFALPYSFAVVDGRFVLIDGEFNGTPKPDVFVNGVPAFCGGQPVY